MDLLRRRSKTLKDNIWFKHLRVWSLSRGRAYYFLDYVKREIICWEFDLYQEHLTKLIRNEINPNKKKGIKAKGRR